MTRLTPFLAGVLLIVGGCVSAYGPSHDDLAAVLRAAPAALAAVRCDGIPEEPTEFRCRYRQQDENGRWKSREVMVAIDGSSWVIIDGLDAPLGR